ncbi:hypothetical protein [Pareuzebyella sediminis]|uniref:hypothetical protein n=1 Tax=Pareuzebyella sediminis TaxID=2607998 RepID=UPI0018E1CE37|nr:hypothetical protein [Pareuzebyella sediminis]
MLFRTLEGKLLMSVHSHRNIDGRYIRYPNLFEVNDSGDKLGRPAVSNTLIRKKPKYINLLVFLQHGLI